MPLQFDRPVGATADVAELEYISALMQTEKLFLRQEGSLTAKDIHFYLKSRHGIRISVEQIEQEIMVELGCTLRAGDCNCRDSDNLEEDEEDVAAIKVTKLYCPSNSEVQRFAADGAANEDDIEVATGTRQKASITAPVPKTAQVQQGSTTPMKPMSMRMRALRVSQAYNEEDYQKYRQYKAKLKANLPQNSNQEETSFESVSEVNQEDEVMKLDMCQTASLLLIPKLRELRWASDNNSSPKETMDVDPIDLVLEILVQESGVEYGQALNEETIRQMLSLSMIPEWPDLVMDDMMKSLEAVPNPRMDRETFLRVLTDDILAYNIDFMSCTKETAFKEVNAMSPNSNEKEDTRKLERIFTASNIDCNADNYRSNAWQMLAWFTVVSTLFAYLFNGPFPIYHWPAPKCENVQGSELLCAIAHSTQNWLELLILLSVVGAPFYYLATVGNSIYTRSAVPLTLFSVACVVAFVTVPFFYRANFGLFHSGPSQELVDSGQEEQNNRSFGGPISMVVGGILVLVQLAQIIPLPHYKRKGYVSYNKRSAMEFKHAANCKVDRLVRNAVKCHLQNQHNNSSMATSTNPTQKSINLLPLSNTMVKYQQSFTETEPVGGIVWTLRKIRDRSLYYEEGVWVWPRLLASNIAQWFTVLIWIGVAYVGIVALSEEEQVWEEVMTNDQLLIVLIVGFPPALLAAFSISLIYVPSTMSSVLRYRSGVVGSLRDRRFLQNRFAMDSANLLFGAAFWTCVSSSASFFVICGLFTFLCIWSETQYQMIRLCSNLIGMLITVIVKQLIMLFIRSRWSRGYYRSRPAVVNFSNTIQEVWNLGLTTFTAIVRAFKFIAILLLYLGRIDGEVFAPGVGWFMDEIPLDGLPHCFYRDVLLHEAHRHPLIERIGFLYLMKIRLGADFGTQGGAAWRLIFTCSLMPWLRKYRQNLGIMVQGAVKKKKKVGASFDKSALKSLSKEALVDNFVVLEEKYHAMAERLKSIGSRSDGDVGDSSGIDLDDVAL